MQLKYSSTLKGFLGNLAAAFGSAQGCLAISQFTARGRLQASGSGPLTTPYFTLPLGPPSQDLFESGNFPPAALQEWVEENTRLCDLDSSTLREQEWQWEGWKVWICSLFKWA